MEAGSTLSVLSHQNPAAAYSCCGAADVVQRQASQDPAVTSLNRNLDGERRQGPIKMNVMQCQYAMHDFHKSQFIEKSHLQSETPDFVPRCIARHH